MRYLGASAEQVKRLRLRHEMQMVCYVYIVKVKYNTMSYMEICLVLLVLRVSENPPFGKPVDRDYGLRRTNWNIFE